MYDDLPFSLNVSARAVPYEDSFSYLGPALVAWEAVASTEMGVLEEGLASAGDRVGL